MLFYKCSRCGNFITFLTEKTAATPVCCGIPMEEVIPNTTDAATEKHVPPMQEEHYIQFIILETKNGYQKKDLKPGDKPEAVFLLADGDEPVAVYENCNLHGLWKATL